MRAAAELLQQGFRLYLLEGGACIGGEIATIESMFGAEESAACAMQPLMLELVSNANATILTCSELLSLRGTPGDFAAEVLGEQADSKAGPQKLELNVGAVIVSTGRHQQKDAISSRLGLELDENGCFKRDSGNGHPILTSRAGVFICRTAQGPKPIEELVIQACAAASHAAALLAPARRSHLVEPPKKNLFAVKAEDEPKIAVVIDQGDADIVEALDIDQLRQYTETLGGVERVEVTAHACDGATIKDLVGTGDFNRLIVAGPSPISDEWLFQRHAEVAGLNRYLLEMVNLHNHCARVHSNDKTVATEKAKILMKMGIARARQLEPLEELKVGITQSCLVVGASAAGVACTAKLAEMGLRVHLVEHRADLERIVGNEHPLAAPLAAELSACEKVEVHAPATIENIQGRLGDFEVELAHDGIPVTVHVGAIVIAAQTPIAESADSTRIEQSLALKKDEDGLYVSTQGSLNPLDFDTEGVFNCGPARAILETEDAVVDGEAAASRAACVLAWPVMPRSPVISCVVHENCDGCAYCVDPCPTRSVTLLEFMLRGEIKKTVEVSDTTCIGCGICMSTCPKKGIFVKHYKLESFREMTKAAMERTDDGPVIVCFCCNRCAYPGADAAGSAGIEYPSSVRIIRGVCSGMIHPNIVMDALTQGADGVLLCGCHPGNCRSREGIRKAQDRTEAIELLLEDFGLEPERFRLEFIAASEGPKFARVIKEMTEELSALGPSPYQST